MQQKQIHAAPSPQLQHKVQQTTQHLPQQPSPKLQTIISKPNQSPPSQPKPIQVPLKQAGQPVPVKAEAVQPATQQKLPSIPARTSSTSPPSSDPPKVKPPQLSSDTPKRTQSVIVPTRGTPPPIPARSGSVQYSQPPTQHPIHPMRRQQTMNSAMPAGIIPSAAPEFYIPQRRGSITRQQSSSASLPTTKPNK